MKHGHYNDLGPSNAEEEPNPPDEAFEARIRGWVERGVPEVNAVMLETLAGGFAGVDGAANGLDVHSTHAASPKNLNPFHLLPVI